MKQYIDKAALVAEIERRIDFFTEESKKGNSDINIAIALCGFENFLDSLEVKEVDLEEKATQLSQKYFPDEENIWARSNIEAQKCKSARIEMVECLKAQKGE